MSQDFHELADIRSYRTLDGLRTRLRSHELFSERPDDVEGAVLAHLDLRPGTAVLDVGSGTGAFVGRLAALPGVAEAVVAEMARRAHAWFAANDVWRDRRGYVVCVGGCAA